MQFHTVTCK